MPRTFVSVMAAFTQIRISGFALRARLRLRIARITVVLAFLLGCGQRVDNFFDRETVAALPEKVDFNFHVKPILSDRCFKCHGPDNNARKAGLRFDTREGAFAALGEKKDHHAITPGALERSEMFRRITSPSEEERMPPPRSNLALTEYEKALLGRWIEQGAEWKAHWSFLPVQQPALPKIKNRNWVKSPIDHFILARLEKEKLLPAPEAKKEQLLRRLTFDLTGLPPTLAELDSFLSDDSPQAYEKTVARLLAAPTYGERMATEWLDVARYADTHGYQDDRDRAMSPWRDWVIA
ncbi:MAG: DUF1549 domain-containing protein, partial [candidate division KSB1 bacterium]